MTRSRPAVATLIATMALATTARGQAARPGITLNFPGPVPLPTLIDYVSARLGLNIIYDDDALRKAGPVTVRAPGPVSADGLLDLLSDVLSTKKFLLTRGAGPQSTWHVTAAADAPPPPPQVERVVLKYAEAARLAPQVKQLVAGSGPGGAEKSRLDVSFDARTNQLILVGPPGSVADAMAVAKLVDVPAPTEQGTLQFYKLTNATAADVLDTIRDLEGRPPSGRARAATPARSDVTPASSINGGGTGGTNSGTPTGGAFGGSAHAVSNVGNSVPPAAVVGGSYTGPVDVQPAADNGTSANAPGRLGGEAVTADPNTNTIIVRGGPEVQRTYKRLIEQLDRRRPQVLLEATVVTIDTTHNFNFGVELSAHSNGATKFLSFSQFGLSSVDVATGALTPNQLRGGTAAVIGTGVANAVINALAQDSRARVRSAPRVLVNDNATGLLASIAEQPFTTINASTTVATTSFGGYAEAGTTISLTPHISEGDYLQLEYAVELSSFTGQADPTTGQPPPRQSDRVESKVTIPDGSTIIVGGLNRREASNDVNAVPILGQIPFLRFLFSSRSNTERTQTLFVFLRPTILRDEQFTDLRNLTEADLHAAGIPANFPQSRPVIMR